ncbi:MAG: hypothetical protein WCI34_02335 [Actinomycetes bacterium]
MLEFTRSRVVVVAIVGLMIAALLGWAVEGLATEKVLLSGASADAGYELTPDGKAAKAASSSSSNAVPLVTEVGPDGKIKVVSGHASTGGSSYTADNSKSRARDD